MNSREIALEIIYKTIKESSFTNLLMRKRLNDLPVINRPFVTNLVNSVLKNFDFLLYQFEGEIKSDTSFRNRIILAMAFYEKYYLNEKDYVVNNEYVDLAKNKYDKAFINALLRKKREIKKASEEHINHSLPKWLYGLLNKQYGSKLPVILDNYKRIPTVYYRINHYKADDSFIEKINMVNDDIFIAKASILDSTEYQNGYFYVQDINSSSLIKRLDLDKNMLLLDACSAPGSKLFNALDRILPENAYGNDLYENRVELIKKEADRLGFSGIHFTAMDARELSKYYDFYFDRIILDVPCSGLGVIGRRPDIKYHINSSSLDELQKLQAEILNSVSLLLKPGGKLLYSTCTLNKKENEKQIVSFLSDHNDFTLQEEETIINMDGDCFYYAIIKRYND